MMDLLHKIVTWTFSPMGFFFLAVGAGWALRRFTRRRRLGGCMIAFAFVELWVLGSNLATRFVGLPLECDEFDVMTLPKAEALVLLGGGVGQHKECLRPELFAGADRAWTAARLMRAGKAPFMTVSGGCADGEIEFLADLGVATNRIFSLKEALNTEDESRMVTDLVRSRRDPSVSAETRPRILLVTSAWHMPRAKMLFERRGFEVIAAPCDWEMHFSFEYPLKPGDFFPTPETMGRNSAAIKEWVARLCYAIKR